MQKRGWMSRRPQSHFQMRKLHRITSPVNVVQQEHVNVASRYQTIGCQLMMCPRIFSPLERL